MKMKMNNDVTLDKIGLRAGKDKEGAFVVMADLRFSFLLTRDKAQNVFGDRFTQLAFAQDKAGNFIYRTVKPDDPIESCSVRIQGLTSQHTTPAIVGVSPAEGEEVDVQMRMAYELQDDKTITTIVKRIGQGIEVSIEPTQMELQLDAA